MKKQRKKPDALPNNASANPGVLKSTAQTPFPSHLLAKAVEQHRVGNLKDAEALYQQLLASYPENIDVLMLLGIAKVTNKDFKNAAGLFEKVIAIKPNHALAYHNYSNALLELKRYKEALHNYDKAIVLDPNNTEIHHNRGVVLLSLKQYDEALASCDKAIAVNPNNAEAYNTRAAILQNLEQYGNALASCDKAIAINSGYASAYNNRGLALHSLKRYDEALASYDKAIAIDPRFVMGYNNRGLTLHTLKQYEAALASCDKAIAIDPDFDMAYNNRGLILRSLKRYDEALASYDKAIALNPDFPDAYWNKSLLLLLLGDYEEGWKLYEWRWKKTGKKTTPASGKPLWSGKEPLAGKTILIHAEQGFGDTIQFCRYVPMVEALGAKVILGAPNAVINLLSSLKGNYILLEQGPHTYEHDFHCPLLSLPLAFKTTLATIPQNVPYLFADPQKQKIWQEKCGVKSKPRIGIVWSGTAHPTLQYDRSVQLDLLSSILRLDFEFHSLQKDIRPEDEQVFKDSRIIPHADELKKFSDTAALIMEMDLVISVDTSVAHLAGALGKQSWFLIHSEPDFRWLLDREDSPWYPTGKLFRQEKTGDWVSVIARVKDELAVCFGGSK